MTSVRIIHTQAQAQVELDRQWAARKVSHAQRKERMLNDTQELEREWAAKRESSAWRKERMRMYFPSKVWKICPSRFVFIVFKYIHCYISFNRFFCLVLLFTKYFRYISVFIPMWLCLLQFAIKMPYVCVIPPFAITIAMRLCHFRSLIFLFKVCKTHELGGAKVCFPFGLF